MFPISFRGYIYCVDVDRCFLYLFSLLSCSPVYDVFLKTAFIFIFVKDRGLISCQNYVLSAGLIVYQVTIHYMLRLRDRQHPDCKVSSIVVDSVATTD